MLKFVRYEEKPCSPVIGRNNSQSGETAGEMLSEEKKVRVKVSVLKNS